MTNGLMVKLYSHKRIIFFRSQLLALSHPILSLLHLFWWAVTDFIVAGLFIQLPGKGIKQSKNATMMTRLSWRGGMRF